MSSSFPPGPPPFPPPAGQYAPPGAPALPYTPGAPPPGPPPAAAPSAFASLVPYKNARALVGYYLAVFSIIPCLGLLLGPAALVLGIMGLKVVRARPEVKGAVHAWIGIVVGGLTTLLNLVGVAIMLFSMTRH